MTQSTDGVAAAASLLRGRRLAVFDMDGTLYRQSGVQKRMVLRLAQAALTGASLRDLRIVRRFRTLREEMADAEVQDFDGPLHERTARETGTQVEQVRSAIRTWIEERPLDLLYRNRIPGVEALFAALRAQGTTIAVLSDYPAREKLVALGLEADIIVSATDPEVGVLKPNPRGLQVTLDKAGCAPADAVMIGDRDERDGEIARRLGTAFVLRAKDGGASTAPCVQDYDALARRMAE